MGNSQADYYLDLARQDYYTRSGEGPGDWWGRGAARLGLEGEVAGDELRHLFQGFTPDGERTLVRNAGHSERRAGFDCTFSAPKSVSVAWAVADSALRDRIAKIHGRAVRQALAYLEDRCASIRLGAGGDEQVAAGFVVGVFQHGTARAVEGHHPDPQLHSHCLVLNVAVTDEGRTGALDARQLFLHKMAAGALYRLELFAELEKELGLVAERRDRRCELEFVPEEVIRQFSKRRSEILTRLREQGLEGPMAAAVAALETRSSKQGFGREDLHEVWRRAAFEAHEFGFHSEDLTTVAQHRPRDPSVLFREALVAARDGILERESHFAERDLLRAVAENLEPEGVGADLVRVAVEGYLARSPEVVPLGQFRGEHRYTTQEMVELEKRLIGRAGIMARQEHAVSQDDLRAALRARPTIAVEQAGALDHLVCGTRLSLLRGMAGTGKTFVLDAAREAWEAAGYRVLGTALASSAAKRLAAGSGIDSRNIHRTLALVERGDVRLDASTVLVVDEAGMVGTRLLERLSAKVEEAGGKLVLVGDEKQLPSIEAGGPFGSLAKEFESFTLTDIRRQRDEWAREAVHEFSSGEAAQAVERFREKGLLHVAETREQALGQLVADWRSAVSASGLRETLVLTGTRLDAHEVNLRIQIDRARHGELKDSCLDVGADTFFVGDRVLFRRNSLQVSNGDTGVVTRTDADRGLLTVKLDSGPRVTIDTREYTNLQLGYAATTHSAQGATVDRCLVLFGGPLQTREATYVQASRARLETRLYADAVSAGEELTELVRDMSRSRQKELALDLAQNTGSDLELVA